MDTARTNAREQTRDLAAPPVDAPRKRARRAKSVIGGGTDGNELLTSMTGAVLIVLLAVLGITILRIQQLIWLHLFLGLVLIGPFAIKMASTGYRFVRYYTRNPAYRFKGPSGPLMRLTAPIVVASTLVVFATGLLLLIVGPNGRGQYLFLHKASFVIWLGATAVHVLGHLWFAAESAGQCGPCVNGLDAIAATIHQLSTGTASHSAWRDLERWGRDMRRRGACQHPDGAIRFISSALRAFEPELRDHAHRDPIRCVAHGLCGELLPEAVRLDEWGYPIIEPS
jgi:hypothetical protein